MWTGLKAVQVRGCLLVSHADTITTLSCNVGSMRLFPECP